MSSQYSSNINVAGLELEINPEQYSPNFEKLGSFKRTISGGIVDVDINGLKLIVEINGLAQSQVEDIKKRVALRKVVDFIDYIPISEKNSRTRVVYEDLGSETIDSELIYLYIPTYKIIITDYSQTYGNNIVEFKLIGNEV